MVALPRERQTEFGLQVQQLQFFASGPSTQSPKAGGLAQDFGSGLSSAAANSSPLIASTYRSSSYELLEVLCFAQDFACRLTPAMRLNLRRGFAPEEVIDGQQQNGANERRDPAGRLSFLVVTDERQEPGRQ